jgi:hypothetical protein
MRGRAIFRAQQQKYFFWHSSLWDALKKHICNEKECKVIVWEPDSLILSKRGNGSAIRLFEAGVYPLQADTDDSTKEPLKYWITFEIDWAKKRDIGGYSINIDEFTKTYTLDIPTDLEVRFTQEKFNSWTQKVNNDRELKIREQEIMLLKKLRKKYPGI